MARTRGCICLTFERQHKVIFGTERQISALLESGDFLDG